MFCDRCGKKTNHIYITESHEKICERTCNGDVNYSTKIFYANPKSSDKLSKSMPLSVILAGLFLSHITDHESTIQHIVCPYYNGSHFGTVRMVNASECQ